MRIFSILRYLGVAALTVAALGLASGPLEVFQDFALMPWASVIRNVGFGLELRGMPKGEREETARRYIEKVGLAGFEDRVITSCIPSPGVFPILWS